MIRSTSSSRSGSAASITADTTTSAGRPRGVASPTASNAENATTMPARGEVHRCPLRAETGNQRADARIGEPDPQKNEIERRDPARQDSARFLQGCGEGQGRSDEMRRDEMVEGERAGSSDEEQPERQHPVDVDIQRFVSELEKRRHQQQGNCGDAGRQASDQKHRTHQLDGGPQHRRHVRRQARNGVLVGIQPDRRLPGRGLDDAGREENLRQPNPENKVEDGRRLPSRNPMNSSIASTAGAKRNRDRTEYAMPVMTRSPKSEPRRLIEDNVSVRMKAEMPSG